MINRNLSVGACRDTGIAITVSLVLILLTPAAYAQRPSIADLQQAILDGEASHEKGIEITSENLKVTCALFTEQLLTLPSECTKTVFVTSATYDGNLGGLDGGHAKCQAAADAAGLPGTFRAWLSDDTLSPATDPGFTKILPYHRTDGVRIADDWTDLTDGSLAASISVDELGQNVSTVVWTGTFASGLVLGTPFQRCLDWTTTATPGFVGSTSSVDGNWTNAASVICTTEARLYCFEQ
jgi:hypothetical protein